VQEKNGDWETVSTDWILIEMIPFLTGIMGTDNKKLRGGKEDRTRIQNHWCYFIYGTILAKVEWKKNASISTY